MQSVLFMASEYNVPIAPGLESSSNWPWKIVMVAQFYSIIKSSLEMAAVHKAPPPPREIIFDRRKVKRWIDDRKPAKSKNKW